MYRKLTNQSGASIVTAIFLIVIMSIMAVGMVSLLATSQQSINTELASARSYMAGRTCLNWGLHQVAYFEGGTITTDPSGTIFTNTFNTDTTSYLYNSECVVKINRISTIPVNGSTDNLKFYNIDVTATYGDISSPEYSKRTMEIDFQIRN